MELNREFPEHNWQAFVASVNELNAYVYHFCLRKYQSDILSKSGFLVVSPATGDVIEVTRSLVVGACIAYPLPDPKNLWLIAGSVGAGFPLYSVVRDDDGASFTLGDRQPKPWNEFKPADVEHLLNRKEQLSRLRRYSAPTLISGHNNFAHHLWNELSAIDYWVQGAAGERVESLTVLATNEPLGPLNEIFSPLQSARVVPVIAHDLDKAACDAPISVRAGSQFVTKSVRDKVLAVAQAHCDGEAVSRITRGLLDDAWPRIWVSTRVGSRTADNLRKFLLYVFRRIFDLYPDAAVFIDGFSFPYGFPGDVRVAWLRESFEGFARSTGEFIDNLCARAMANLGRHKASQIVSISGISLAEAILIGGRCDYYICHAGTLQHKIGWIHSIPGFVHMPRPGHVHAAWAAAQAEGAIIPHVFPAGFVRRSSSEAERKGAWNYNYRFIDPRKSADFVLEQLVSSLTLSGNNTSASRTPALARANMD